MKLDVSLMVIFNRRGVVIMEITQKEIDDTINNCEWKMNCNGVDVCGGELGACGRIIESGKCPILKELFAKR